MNLERWLRKHNMETKQFALIVGCARHVLWKVKREKPVSPNICKKIFFATSGHVRPVAGNRVGRPTTRKILKDV